MPEKETKTGRGCVIAAVVAAAVLTALNLLFLDWSVAGSQSVYGASRSSLGRILVWLAVWLILAAAAALILRRVRTASAMTVAIPVYAAMLIAVLIARSTGQGKWLRISYFNLYVPALLYLSLLLTACMVSLYRRLDRLYVIPVFVGALVVPFALAALTGPGVGIILALTLLLLAFRLWRDRRLSGWWIVFPVLLALVLLLALDGRSVVWTLIRTRIEVFLTQGQSDPMGSGWTYSHLIAALRGASLFGGSDYALETGRGAALPAYRFIAYSGYEYLPAAMVIRFGWAALLLPAAAALCLPICLFRLSRTASNSYSRYLSFSVGALFLVRTVLGTVSSFALFLGSSLYPFVGNVTCVSVDVLLLTAALVLSRKEEDLSDLLDRETPAAQLLPSRADDAEREPTLRERLLRLLQPYDLDDEELEDEDFLDFDEEDDFGAPRVRRIPDRGRARGPWPEDREAEAEGLTADIRELQAQLERLQLDRAALERDNADLLEINRTWTALLESRRSGSRAARTGVFICYDRLDLPCVEMLCGRLEARGLECCYADRDFPAGDYPPRLIRALNEARAFVLVLTAAANGSARVCNEAALAAEMIGEGLVLMPLILEDVPLSEDLRHSLLGREQTVAIAPPLEEQLDRFADKLAAELAD